MVAIGVALLLVSYGSGLYGYSLIRGYCNSFSGLWNPLNPAAWSTTIYTGNGVIPSGCGNTGGTTTPAGGSLPGIGGAGTVGEYNVGQETQQNSPTGTTNPK
jgi:hypothetical protein